MSCWKACVPPQYVILSVMGFLGIVVSIAARGCLSMAITEMVVPIQKTNAENKFSFCPTDEPSGNTTNGARTAHEYSKRYNWTEQQQGWILSSFYAGYLLSHIPAGVLSERFGGKVTLSLTVFLTAVFNAVTLQAVEYGGYYALIVLRTFMGLFGGMTFPAINVLLAAWIPAKRRGALGSFVMTGSIMGFLISFYISGMILSYYPWPVAFYFWSIVCGIWVALFLILCYKDPASHPFIPKKELDYLKVELKELERESATTTPWKSILTSAPVMALIIVQMSHDCFAVTISATFPKYMKEILGFSIDRVGLYLSLSLLIMWICSFFYGFLSDRLVNRKCLTIVQARKLYAVLAGIIPTATLVVASYAGCDRILFVTLLIVAMSFDGFYFSGTRINTLDLSKNYAGTIMSIANGCGAFASWIFPNFIGMMIQSDSHHSPILQWRNVFWTLVGIATAGVGTYLISASGDVQPWNDTKESEPHECDKMTDEKDIFIQ